MRWSFLLVVLFWFIATGLNAAAETPAAGQDFLLFYSNDVQGETEPCG